MTSQPFHIVAMGVSATGKTTIGKAVAAELDCEFIEGDDYHPPANIEKMSNGHALDDEDRRPWLEALGAVLGRRDDAQESTVLTCSALRRSYRDLLSGSVTQGRVFFVHLHAPFAVLEERMAHRTKHFMPVSLLVSQFDTLEPLGADEAGALVDVSASLEDSVAEALRAVRAWCAARSELH